MPKETGLPTRGRLYQDGIYEQFALVGKALGNPSRLEILDLLLQADRTVEVLASEASMSVANTSHHLQLLKRARLVESERRGHFIVYRVAGPTVGALIRSVRAFGEQHLAEIERATREFLAHYDDMEAIDCDDLVRRAKLGDCVIIDVRPTEEYEHCHLECAVSVPLKDLELRMAELPHDADIVAYCRGPFCILAVDAVEALRKRGFRAVRLRDGVTEWRQQGMPLIRNPRAESPAK